MSLQNHVAKVSAEVNRVEALMSSAPDDYVSMGAAFAALEAGGGLYSIYTGLDKATYYVHGLIGGLVAGIEIVGGKLTIAKRINKRGYTGSCSLFTVALGPAYTNFVGYDEHAQPVLWFNGGGVGLDLFLGGGRFEIYNTVPEPKPTPQPGKPVFVRKADITTILERDIHIVVPTDKGQYWEVEDSSKNDGSRIQIWNSDAPARTWHLMPAGTDKDGHDLFKLRNTKLNTYATFDFNPAKDRLDGFPITSSAFRSTGQTFKVARDASGRFSIYVTDTAAMVRENNHSGNSTKILAKEVNADSLESSLWNFQTI